MNTIRLTSEQSTQLKTIATKVTDTTRMVCFAKHAAFFSPYEVKFYTSETEKGLFYSEHILENF